MTETPKNRLLAISNCRDCPYFDNEYYTYMETCVRLNRKIEGDYMDYKIPEDCPLPKEDE